MPEPVCLQRALRVRRVGSVEDDELTGGRTFGPSTSGLGGDETSTGVLGAPAPGTCTVLISCLPQPPYSPAGTITVQVPPASATLLTGRTPPHARAKR